MKEILITSLIVIVIFGILHYCSSDSIIELLFKKLKKEERAKKEAEELEQRLRDEDKYDNDYRKRHS